MKNNAFLKKSVILLGLFTTFSFAQLASAAEYKIDKAHSRIGYEVTHVLLPLPGNFSDFSMTLQFDALKPEATQVTAEVKAASITSGDTKRDEHLKSPDFFDVKKYPTIRFVSKEVTADGDKKYKMTGDFTMHGVTKSVTFNTVFKGEYDDAYGRHVVDFTAESVINRKDYGINWSKVLDNGGVVVGEEVTIKLVVEGFYMNPKKDAKKDS